MYAMVLSVLGGRAARLLEPSSRRFCSKLVRNMLTVFTGAKDRLMIWL
jgi:hypothetical protein